VGDVLAATLAASDNASSAVRDRFAGNVRRDGPRCGCGQSGGRYSAQNGNDAARWSAIAGVADALARQKSRRRRLARRVSCEQRQSSR